VFAAPRSRVRSAFGRFWRLSPVDDRVGHQAPALELALDGLGVAGADASAVAPADGAVQGVGVLALVQRAMRGSPQVGVTGPPQDEVRLDDSPYSRSAFPLRRSSVGARSPRRVAVGGSSSNGAWKASRLRLPLTAGSRSIEHRP